MTGVNGRQRTSEYIKSVTYKRFGNSIKAVSDLGIYVL